MSEAILLYTVVAIGPIPPEIENTRGAKEPCSISLTLSSYARFFSCSFILYSTALGTCYDKMGHVGEYSYGEMCGHGN